MIARVYTVAFEGVDTREVDVQVQICFLSLRGGPWLRAFIEVRIMCREPFVPLQHVAPVHDWQAG